MSKFCSNCGNMLDDTAAFCDRCGKPFDGPNVQPAAPQYEAPAAPQYEAPAAPQYEAPAAPQYQAPSAPQYGAAPYGAPQDGAVAVAEKTNPMQAIIQFIIAKKIFFIIGVVVLAAAIALIIILTSSGGSAASATGALEKAFNSGKNLDLRGAADVSYDLNFGNGSNKEEEIKKQEEQMKEYASMVTMAKEMMKDAKLTVAKDEAVSEDELKSLKESWASSYKDTDKISEIHKLEYEITGVMGSSQSGECYAVKVGGSWYVKDFTGVGSI